MLSGPVFALALVLGVAGIGKLARPTATRRALRDVGLPSGTWAARALGLAEVVVASLVLAFGTAQACALMAAAYLGFTIVALRLATTDRAPCGCFGQTDAPTGPLHVVVNAVATLVALAGVARPPGSAVDVVAAQPLAGVPFVALVALAAWLWYALLEILPGVLAETVGRPA